MTFNTIDFSKFDVTKLFDAENVLAKFEENTQKALGMIQDPKAREVSEAVASASIEFAKAQTIAVQAYADALKSAFVNK